MAGAAALATLATPALAQDANEFSGIYVGGSFGYDVQPNDVGERIEFDRNLDGSFNDTVLTPSGANAFSPGFCNGAARANNPGVGCRNDKDDIGYYARVGGDYQFGPIVLGVVGEFGKSEISDSVSAFSTTPASYTLTRELDWEAMIRGRAGFAADRTLFYGTAGVGYARITNSFVSSQSVNTFTPSDDNDEFGLVAGGGVEQKIGDNFSIGLEYLFHRYKDEDGAGRVAGGTDFRRNFDFFRWHSLRAVAAFRF